MYCKLIFYFFISAYSALILANSSKEFLHCKNPDFGDQPVQESIKELIIDNFTIKFHELNPECRPKILYSWGSLHKKNTIWSFLENQKSTWDTRLAKEIYTSSFPVQTFFYGELSLRIKLDDKVQFVRGNSCYELAPSLLDANSIPYVLYTTKESTLGTTFEIILCNANAIREISYGTFDHYLETIRELDLIFSGEDAFSYVQYGKGTKGIEINNTQKGFMNPSEKNPLPKTFDGREITYNILQNNLHRFNDLLKAEEYSIITKP